MSVLCFAWLAVALFANERVNRGLSSAADSLKDLGADIRQAVLKVPQPLLPIKQKHDGWASGRWSR